MLKNISIKNYILIENVSIDFNEDFSVITGETGAGKSILIDAFSLVLGKRADAKVLLDKNKKCIVEASFDISKLKINDFFDGLDLDYEDITIIRREINSKGKSRAFINDTPVNISDIKELASKLVDLHSQHENLSISNLQYRIGLVDSIAGTVKIYEKYKQEYKRLNEYNSEIRKLSEELNTSKADIDYANFQIEQIESLEITNTEELDELENQSSILENAEEIKVYLQKAAYCINNNEKSISDQLKDVKADLIKISGSYAKANSFIDRIESVLIELNDIESEISSDEGEIEVNQQLLDTTNQRIDKINSVLDKHNCSKLTDLLEVLDSYKQKIRSTDELENSLAQKTKIRDELKSELNSLAEDLSKKREISFKKIESTLINTLKDLGMPHAAFSIKNNKQSNLTETGIDSIEFLFSANKNMSLQPLEQIASGGELSRLMLTIKSLLAKGLELPTIIFDEIDTGVSGEIAGKMASIMSAMANERQVISITHLPQVAAKGKHHFKISKNESSATTITTVCKLNQEARVSEIASMISGEKTTPQAIENAKILLS